MSTDTQYLSLTLDAYNEFKTVYDITILEVMQMMPQLLEDTEISKNFYLNLGLGYIFTIAGSVSVFKNSYKQAN